MQMVRLAILLVDDMASAEDVVQEAFAGLYRNWGGLRDRNAAIGYLRTAVVNGSRSMLRRRRTARAYVPPDPGTARSAESLAMLSAEHQAVVTRARRPGPSAARSTGTAVLRRAVRGRDRRGHRTVQGHREVDRKPGGGQTRRHHAGGALVTVRGTCPRAPRA